MVNRAIITGATGAVGTALINELISNGTEVLVFCRKGSARANRIPAHPLVFVKYCDLDELESVKNDTGKEYDVFYHFAWSGTTGASRNDMYLQNLNVKHALDAVKAAVEFGCKTFIGAGSQAEYGRVEGKLAPDTPAFPENGYGMAKLCAGQMTRILAEQLGIRHIWVRILSVYGPGDGVQSLVMTVINKLKAGETPECTKGEQLWDYLYSGDAATAFRLLAEKGVNGKTYVLGGGEVRPLAEYIRDIRDIVAPDAEIAFGAISYAPKQVMHLQADVSAIMDDVGWVAKTEFGDGIRNVLGDVNVLRK